MSAVEHLRGEVQERRPGVGLVWRAAVLAGHDRESAQRCGLAAGRSSTVAGG